MATAGIAVIALVAIAIALVAFGPSPKASEVRVGEPGHAGQIELTVLQVRDEFLPANSEELDRAVARGDTPYKIENSKFVAVEIRVTNRGSKAVTTPGVFQFGATDATDGRYPLADVLAVDPPEPAFQFFLLGGELNPDNSQRGWIVLEVPRDAAGVQLVFTDIADSSGGAASSAVFDLGV